MWLCVQVAAMDAHYEAVPAVGVETTVQLARLAPSLGGCDFVLVHPDLLVDHHAPGGGIVQRLR